MIFDISKIKSKLPKSPGVYFMKDARGRILYVGKAGNLFRRISSYFNRPQDARISKMISEISKIDWTETDTVIEALILEAESIKRYLPPFNVKDKDDKSFLYVVITREKFSRVLVLRYKEAMAYDKPLARFGPFTEATSLRIAVKILRKIFPWSDCDNISVIKDKNAIPKPCFNYQIGLCPGNCINAITGVDYKRNIKRLIGFFRGKKKSIIDELKKDMKLLVKELRYEDAAKIKNKIFALQHIQDVALIANNDRPDCVFHRIEGYDISNISGLSAVGSMVVFIDGLAAPNEYRKFKIKTMSGANDVGMMNEVLRRRLRHAEWDYPDIILVDGGMGQVNTLKNVLREYKLDIPVVGIAKGPERKRNDFLYPLGMHKEIFKIRSILVCARDEAHRFAVKYHRELRDRIID